MSLQNLIFLTGVCFLVCQVSATNERLKELFSWKTIDFDFQDDATRTKALESKEFIKENNLILGLERWKDKLFVTVPRWKDGIPSTLNYISLSESKGNPSPNLKPYPNAELNDIHKENGTKIVSVFRINVDVCDRLWLVDTGLADILGEGKQISTPRIVVIDLNTDKIIKEHTIAKEDITENSFFANILVDTTPNTCDKAFAYIPDLGGFQMIVFDLEHDESYKVKHHYFYFDPLSGNYNVGGVNFQWTDGVFGVALSPVHKEDGYRTLYFHPLSSTREFSVNTKILQNKTIASSSYYEFKVLGSRGPNTQATAESLDEKTGVLFYTQVNKDGVGCWNTYKHANEYSADTNDMVATDSETLVFPNDLKVDKEGYLWVLSDRLPVHTHKGLNPEEINYRIFQTPIKEAIKGTACDV
uniref:Protein yellow n=1 Tax=Cacopsylla melanoneura TaxID=428564 RepID=A0A8D8ZPD2_9HEMI